MLYDILKWPSEGTKLLRNIHTLVWVGAIYDKFFFTAYATPYNSSQYLHGWSNAVIDTSYIFMKAFKFWRDRIIFSAKSEFKNT